MLIEGSPNQHTALDHLGVEVETTGEVSTAADRLAELGLFAQVENDTTCCYAVQDKVWVHGPGAEPWEVYAVEADAPRQPASTRWASRPTANVTAAARRVRMRIPSEPQVRGYAGAPVGGWPAGCESACPVDGAFSVRARSAANTDSTAISRNTLL